MELTAKSIESADLNFSRYGDTFFECKDWYDVYEDEILIARAVVPFDYGMVLSIRSDAFIGVNIGMHLSRHAKPYPCSSGEGQQIRHVRLYDVDRAMLLALANSGIHVTISVPNNELLGVGQSNALLLQTGSQNVALLMYHLPTSPPLLHQILMTKLKFPHLTRLPSSPTRFPPSRAFFNRSWDPVMVPLLKFLQTTGSPPLLNVYPYYDYMQSNDVIPLDYALFRPLPPNKEAVDSNTLLHYKAMSLLSLWLMLTFTLRWPT
ncbi:hypothetical protein IFM89_016586 [Coptis chinensis]|uniref:Glucan endo-1,3-beta-D-glucosidase n=1 Tax=Coptis chinensis TaxID=261450 RepID=A0A835HYY1_9MAGN|nr:hypothetical protein IFM89_016586 [Coptis chinensis]